MSLAGTQEGGARGAGLVLSSTLTIDESLKDELAVLLDQVVHIAEDSTVRTRNC